MYMLELEGKFIVARPTMRDARFHEAVLVIIEHTKSHSMGLVINKPVTKPNIADLRKDFKVVNNKHQPLPFVFYGGPVALNKVIVLHTPDWESPKNTFKFNDEIWASNSKDIMSAVLEDGINGPSKWAICIGQCQWMPGQLEAEVLATNGRLRTDSWLPMPADPNVIFGMKIQNRWKKSLRRLAENQFNRIFNHAVETQ